MFYHITVSQTVDLEPVCFGPNLGDHIRQRVISKVEGTCSHKHGYIMCVVRIEDMGQGKIRKDGSGLATFNVRFSCVAMRPFKGEVMDARVTSVNKMGFFAEAGPLQIFVSSHLIQDGYEYDSSGEPAFVSPDQQHRLREGVEVRTKIVGVRVDATEIFCIGTLKEDYLGILGA